MAADSKHAEALARIEHKIDVLMSMMMFLVANQPGGRSQLMTPTSAERARVGSPQHKCPLCAEIVEYFVDPIDSVVVRKCGCKTGKLAPIDLGAFAPPGVPARKEHDDGEQEDRSNSDPRRRSGKR